MNPVDWGALSKAETSVAKGKLFDILQDASVALQFTENDESIYELVPRIADLMGARGDLESFREIFSSFARAVGLWNYIDRASAPTRDRLIAEMAEAEGLSGVTFHKGQVEALNILLSGRNLILSAPTSFGKSLLIDALLAKKKFRRVVIVVPTIALLDEFRRRIKARFNRAYALVLHPTDPVPEERNVIFLGTQERLIGRTDLRNLDLVVVDEFYKLDEAREDERSTVLNAVVYRMLHEARQFFFLGPNIASVTNGRGSGWRFEFLRTRYSTVAVNTFDLHDEMDKSARLITEAMEIRNWPALIFVSSPKKAQEVGGWLVAQGKAIGTGEGLAEWIAENFGPEWSLVDTVRSGIGIHHAKIPRSLAARFVKLFNDRTLPVLVCTSTLIEGVNTAAKSVLVYDKRINRKDYDFFTFSNIRGRAGRLGEHYVGNVYLFHEPPSASATEVTAPLFGDAENASDEFVVHMEDRDGGAGVRTRISRIAIEVGISVEDLRRFSGLGFEQLLKIKGLVQNSLAKGDALVWRGRPSYEQILAVTEVVCATKPVREFGALSDRQLAYLIRQLRRSTTLKAFFRQWFSFAKDRLDIEHHENVFRFLRSCEHTLPEILGAIELFVRGRHASVDYSHLVAGVSTWFRPPAVKQLEEQGVPVQISEPLYRDGDSADDLADRLRGVATYDAGALSGVERAWILDALPA